MPIASESINAYLEALSSRKSTPGGGAVAAFSGAQAAGLISMVLEFSEDFEGTVTRSDLISEAKFAVQRFTQLADEDAVAFSSLMQAYRNKGDIQSGLKTAATPPLACLALLTQLAERLAIVKQHGNANLITDTAIAALLLRDTILASELNVLINLRSIEDDKFKTSARSAINSAKEQIQNLESIAADISQQLL